MRCKVLDSEPLKAKMLGGFEILWNSGCTPRRLTTRCYCLAPCILFWRCYLFLNQKENSITSFAI